jgi:hypothetical protein
MPRLAIDYSKTLIYKLVCNDLSILECYVGHTTDFIRRKQCHKTRCHNEKGKYYNTKVYATIRENGGWINWTMIEIEKYPCRDDNEARAKEREWFENLNSYLNTNYPQRSLSEYQQDNKEKINQYKEQYRENNKDKVRLHSKTYEEKHKKERAIKRSEMFECECGNISTWFHKSRHFKSIFHKQYMERVMVEADSTSPIKTIDDDADTQLVRGICYIPLAQFENMKQQEEINDDHFYFSNHYDYMHQQ